VYNEGHDLCETRSNQICWTLYRHLRGPNRLRRLSIRPITEPFEVDLRKHGLRMFWPLTKLRSSGIDPTIEGRYSGPSATRYMESKCSQIVDTDEELVSQAKDLSDDFQGCLARLTEKRRSDFNDSEVDHRVLKANGRWDKVQKRMASTLEQELRDWNWESSMISSIHSGMRSLERLEKLRAGEL
jgi:hypothetical protein